MVTDVQSAAVGTAARLASEIFGRRKRPYDMRWGVPEQVKAELGIGTAALKAAWLRGWVRARQACWSSDDRRTQTVYCFEDLHVWLESAAHPVGKEYAKRWWTDVETERIAAGMKVGPYAISQTKTEDNK